MAERKAFQARPTEIQPPPVSKVPNELAAGLEEFGARLQDLSGKLLDTWLDQREREEAAKGTQAGASGVFTPKRTGTRAGDAYDRAGLESYFERLKIQTSDEVDRISRENQQDPAKLESSLAGFRDGITAELTKSTPELLPHFDAFFDRTSRPYRRQAAADYEKVQAGAALAATSDALASMYRQHEQRAFLSDGSIDGTADIALNRNEYVSRLVASGPKEAFILNGQKYDADPQRAGAFDVANIGKEIAEYDRAILGARVKGEFNRAFKAGRGERFVDRFQKDESRLGVLSLGERDDLAQWMRGQISADRSMREATDKALGAAVDAAIGAIHKGETPGGLDDLVARTRGTPKGEELRLTVDNQDRLTDFYRFTPAQQAAQLDLERGAMKGQRAPGGGGDEAYARETRARTNLIEGMQVAQKATVDGLRKDPYLFAVQVGNISQPPDLVGEDGLIDPSSLQTRSQDAKRMSELYGVTFPPMMDEEIDAFGQLQSAADPVRRSANVARLTDGIGQDQALAIFERMDKKGYLIDAAAGSMVLDGAPDLAPMIYQGDALLQPVEGKTLFKFPESDFDLHFANAAGTAFALNPRAELTVKEAAKRIYVASLARSGGRPDAVVDGTKVKAAFEAVMGGPLIKHGGGMFGSSTIVTPPFRGATADDFDAWWESIDGKAVKAAGGLAGWKDDEAAELIRERGLPVEIGQGVYKVVIPGAGQLDLTATAKASDGKALILRFAKAR